MKSRRTSKNKFKHKYCIFNLRRTEGNLAARSKACVCARSLAEVMGSNPAGGMYVCFLRMLCFVR
jgi:hypothetical protein